MIVIIILLIIMVDIYFETSFPKINKVRVKSHKIASGKSIKILQVTDYHNYSLNKRVLKLIRKAEADITVITGDLIDRTTKDFNNVCNFLEGLFQINRNIFYVSGNHELKSGRMKELLENIKKRNINVINNDNETMNIKGCLINICGVDYPSDKFCDITKALEGLDNNLYTVMLCHRPDIVQKYDHIPVDLILSGHTHGGQIRFPLIGAAIAPGQGMLPRYNKGLYSIYDDTLLYVDSGVGTTRLPIRFLNRSQISLLSIEGK